MNREIPIVADDYADLEFGTGAVKMTPAHDPNDFEVAQRHDLPIIRVLNDDGTMNENAGKFAGMTREACREAVVEELKKLGLLVKVEPLKHNVGTCYRCHDNVEPLVSTQWFVKMKPLAEPAIEVAKNKELVFVPERFEKTYLNWMENIRDWCISRQLWWGHRIPAFYCEQCGEITVSREDITTCPKCGGHVHQDEDVLDTWFSSALWPFSTLGWPEETEDLKYFYPNSVLSCGYDIIFFWLARMVFSGIEQMGKCPFHVALMHGLVRDAQGRKMSKSLGNGIDPIAVIDKYGADALRFSLEMGVSPGADVRMSEEKIESFRNFVNKIWNASRFVLMNLEGFTPEGVPNADELELCDKWILTKFQETAREITDDLEKFELGLAATKLYDFMWSNFCDWYIELAKQGLNGGDEQRKKATQEVLYYVLLGTLKLLHPYIPFVTEEVYSYLPGVEGMLITARWPEVRPEYGFPAEAARMEGVMEVIRTVRNLRAEMNVAPGRRATLLLKPHEGWKDALAAAEGYFRVWPLPAPWRSSPPTRPTRKSRPAPSLALRIVHAAGRTGGCGKGDRPPAKGQKERRRRDRPRAGQIEQPGLRLQGSRPPHRAGEAETGNEQGPACETRRPHRRNGGAALTRTATAPHSRETGNAGRFLRSQIGGVSMRIVRVQERHPVLIHALLDICERSVRATHLFLSDGKIESIKEYVSRALMGVENLTVAENEDGQPVAFMGTESGTLEMLFIAPEERARVWASAFSAMGSAILA